MNHKYKFIFAIFASLLLFTGCAKPKPVKTEHLSLDLVQCNEHLATNNKTIIILQPKLKAVSVKNTQSNDIQSQIARLKHSLSGPQYNFNTAYNNRYGKTFGVAFKKEIGDILRNEGFNVIDEYEKYEDLDFSIRKNAYLIIEPFVEASFITLNVESENSGNKIIEHGTVKLAGTVHINLLEPLSRERISSERIDLSQEIVSRVYTSIRTKRSSSTSNGSNALAGAAGSLFGANVTNAGAFNLGIKLGKSIGSSIGDALFSSNEVDTTNNTLIAMVNDTYKTIIDQTVPKLQENILLSYANDISEIKSKKRY